MNDTNKAPTDEYQLTDGGDITPGWGPHLSEKHAKVIEKIREERAENGYIETRTDTVYGTLAQGMAWNRPCYILIDAVDDKGQKFAVLRLPEASGLYRALGFKKMGAKVRITYQGTVEVTKGGKTLDAHRFDVATKDAANYQLSAPRPDALVLLSEDQKKHLEELESLKEAQESIRRRAELANVRKATQRLLQEANGVVDAEFEDFGGDIR